MEKAPNWNESTATESEADVSKKDKWIRCTPLK
jgi:hypothetical protein